MTMCQECPDCYQLLSPEELAARIQSHRRALGNELLILCHHYQKDDVVRHADFVGDSLRLSQWAADEAAHRGGRYIVFCGVSFMAETARILADDSTSVLIPNHSALCPMAAMADEESVGEAWDAIASALGDDQRVVPVAYVNTTAAVKSFVGAHGGACCTSSNAEAVFRWAFNGRGRSDTRILFLPDQHLGRNVIARLQLDAADSNSNNGAGSEIVVWDPNQMHGGVTPAQLRRARVILWAGHCSVHTRFRAEDVRQARREFADRGGVRVIVHPECTKDVVDLADDVGSTEFIANRIDDAPAGSNWVVGTEAHLVNRLARRAADRGVCVRMLGPGAALCGAMFRITAPRLLWVLDAIVHGQLVNEVHVPPSEREHARLALQRMFQATRIEDAQ
jgi:quinolinate synthase